MQLNGARALLTGAAGGIGRAIAVELVRHGTHVLLVDRDERALDDVAKALALAGGQVQCCVADLTSAEDRSRLCEVAREWRGGVNILINNAGLNPFGLFETLTPSQIDASLAVNLQAPVHLCRELLAHLRAQPAAAILNTGSVFGSIGFPGYVAYSTSKFALRGFTEALRRELAGSTVAVQYLAPRATRTPINGSVVEAMNLELGVSMDPPERVAREVVQMLVSGRSFAVIGWPEKLFARINAVLPGLVDRALRKQLPVIERHAKGSGAARQASAVRKPAASAIALVLTFAALLLGPMARAAGADGFAAELLEIQHAWEKANYETQDADARKQSLEQLSSRSDAFVREYPGQAEPLVWQGIVLSTYAGVKGGLGALSLAKKSRDTLLEAVKIDGAALNGSAYTSLGALYYKVPGWPLGFGDHAKAAEYLRKALAMNPNGIDPNFFYGELLFEDGDYAHAIQYLQKAMAAAPRPDRPIADAGRRAEISALIAKARSKQG